jgi:hypothetical protein
MEYICNTLDEANKALNIYSKGQGDIFICSDEVFEYFAKLYWNIKEYEKKKGLNMQLKIEPKNGYLLLETFDLPKETGKIILPNAPKDTQLYKVVGSDDHYADGNLVYLKCSPQCVTQGEKKFYFTEPENVIAVVEL